MATEIVDILKPEDGKIFIDMTFGSGGHTKRLLDTNKSIKVIAVDRDPVAYESAQKLAAQVAIKSEKLNINQSVIPIHGKFSSAMKKIHLSGVPYGSVNGVLFDLGASSMQFDNPKRGFALSQDGPLDMRMDPSNESDITAEDVVNSLGQDKLGIILKLFGEEKKSRKVANAIVDARTLLGRIKSTQELARIIASTRAPTDRNYDKFTHPATRAFQAIRIFVNNELNELNYALDKIYDFLIPTKVSERATRRDSKDFIESEVVDNCGIAVALTFHSLEDRIVKRHFNSVDQDEPTWKALSQSARIRTNMMTKMEEIEQLGKFHKWKPIYTHVQKPSPEEVILNPRSRSAKLRAAIRLREDDKV